MFDFADDFLSRLIKKNSKVQRTPQPAPATLAQAATPASAYATPPAAAATPNHSGNTGPGGTPVASHQAAEYAAQQMSEGFKPDAMRGGFGGMPQQDQLMGGGGGGGGSDTQMNSSTTEDTQDFNDMFSGIFDFEMGGGGNAGQGGMGGDMGDWMKTTS